MTALVGGDRDALHVLLQRRIDDLADRAVVTEVDDLGAGRLQDAARMMLMDASAAVEGGAGDETHLFFGL